MTVSELETQRTPPADRAAADMEKFRSARITHWNDVARILEDSGKWGKCYHERLAQVYRFLTPPDLRVLELGCGEGDLLAALEPAVGVGIDFSEEMIERARRKHPRHTFVGADAHDYRPDAPFDVIILSDLVNDLWDVQEVFARIRLYSTPRTRVIINSFSHLWELPLSVVKRLGLAQPSLYQNWLAVEDMVNLLKLEEFEPVKVWQEFLWPFRTPLLAGFFNRFLVKLWPWNLFALTNFIVARPVPSLPREGDGGKAPSVSVIIAARNEAGNIEELFGRTPEIGSDTELVFVEGHSRDKTYEAIEQAIADHPERRCQLHRQSGVGKGDAVRLGFEKAGGDVLMILDADMTMPPEDLPRYYDALCAGKGEFINGVRLVYPMERKAMRFFNLLGNKFFSKVFSWALGQQVKDTLCGTKVLYRSDYERIAANRAYFGTFDPFGDFDLIFGAAKLGLKIIDMPIRYRERTYGAPNIDRWRDGLLLLRMVVYAARRIKFV
jgi:SAM-dependent methyltransferase